MLTDLCLIGQECHFFIRKEAQNYKEGREQNIQVSKKFIFTVLSQKYIQICPGYSLKKKRAVIHLRIKVQILLLCRKINNILFSAI